MPTRARIDRSQYSQQLHRVGQGVRSGEINPREAHRLASEQARIRRLESRIKFDDAFTLRERRLLGNKFSNPA